MEELKIGSQLAELLAPKSPDKAALQALQSAPVSFNGMLNQVLTLPAPAPVAPDTSPRETSSREPVTADRDSSVPVNGEMKKRNAPSIDRRRDSKVTHQKPGRKPVGPTDKGRSEFVAREENSSQPLQQDDKAQVVTTRVPGSQSEAAGGSQSADNAPSYDVTPRRLYSETVVAPQVAPSSTPGEAVASQGAPVSEAPVALPVTQVKGDALPGPKVDLVVASPVAGGDLQSLAGTEASKDVQPSHTLSVAADVQEELSGQVVRVDVLDPVKPVESAMLPKAIGYTAPGSDMQLDMDDIEQFIAKYSASPEEVPEEKITTAVRGASLSFDTAEAVQPDGTRVVPAKMQQPLVQLMHTIENIQPQPEQPAVIVGAFDAETATVEVNSATVELPEQAARVDKGAVLKTVLPEVQPIKAQPAGMAVVPTDAVMQEAVKSMSAAGSQSSAQQGSGQSSAGTQSGVAVKVDGVQAPGPVQGGTSAFQAQVEKVVQGQQARQTGMVDRISAMLKQNGTRMSQSFRMTLNPQNLGEVRVDLQVRGGTVKVHIVTENQQATHVLQNGAGDLRAALEQNGIQLDGFDVQSGLSDSQGQNRAHDDSHRGRRDTQGFQRQQAQENNDSLIPVGSFSGLSGLDLVA